MRLTGHVIVRWNRAALRRYGFAFLIVSFGLVISPQTLHTESVMHGFGFSPYMNGQAPPVAVPEQQTRNRLGIVAFLPQWIRTWGMRSGLELIPPIAKREFGLKIAGCAWLDGSPGGDVNNEIQKDNLIACVVAGDCDIAIVGTESMVSDPPLDKDALIGHLMDVRRRLDAAGFGRGGAKFVPVATAEPFSTWANAQAGGLFHREGGFLVNGAVLKHVDVLFVHLYPFHEGVHIDDAIAELDDLSRRTRSAVDEVVHHIPGVPDLPIAIGETGWPSAGNINGLAEPTLANAERYFWRALAWASDNDRELFYFEAFDENWKLPGYANVERHWGLYYADGTPKFFPAPPPGRAYTIHVGDDPLYGGRYPIDETVDGAHIAAEFAIKGNGYLEGNGVIEGDLEGEGSDCALDFAPVGGPVRENGGVIRLKMKAPISGGCSGQEVSGKLKIKGEIDSDGLFSGTMTVQLCAETRCDKVLDEPISFDLGGQQGGPWSLKIKNLEVAGEGPAGKKMLSGKCTLKLDGSAATDWLRFKLAGTYDMATGASTVKCKAIGSFSKGAKVQIEDFVVRGGEIISGRIGGQAFGQQVFTPVLYSGSM